MVKADVKFKDGVLFANGYNRIVKGARGSYLEFEKDQLEVELESKYDQKLPELISDEIFYYYWLRPVGRKEKVYWQANEVKYADYKIGKYYIDVNLLKDFSITDQVWSFEFKEW